MDESKSKVLLGTAAVALLGAAAIFFWPKPKEPTSVITEPQPAPAPDVAPQYPVPKTSSDAPPLPELEASDSFLVDLVSQLFGADAVQNFLVTTDIVRHVVVTIDNLPRKKVAERLKPIKPIPGKFQVTGPEGGQSIAKENAARYTTLVQLFEAVDTQTLATAYFRVYPLLQQAYIDLGYPDAYFNNRLVEVIDHLLATPTVQPPIRVVQPNVLYEYADPQLEALSAGQKILIRIGPEHAARVKRKLRELRAAITAKGPGAQ